MKRNLKLKRWLKQLECDMTAAAFAEAGEFETAHRMMREDRRILLAITDEKRDVNAFKYALNMCKRIGAALEILFPLKSGKEALENFIRELKEEDIDHKLIEARECVKDEILKYTNKRRDILFVVIESSDGLDLHCEDDRKKISASWDHLKCPLVVVSELAQA